MLKNKSHIRRYTHIFFLLGILLAVISGNAAAQEAFKEVQVIGTGTIRGDEVATAREEAISESLVTAVSTTLAGLIPAETIAAHFKTLDQTLFSNTGDFIREYQVLMENTSGPTYRILVRASVLSDKLKDQLSSAGILAADTDLPKILFLLAEQNIGDVLPQYWWGEDPSFVKPYAESAMVKVLIEKGFFIIDHDAMILFEEQPLTDSPTTPLPGDASGSTTQSVDEPPEPLYFNNPYLSNEEAVQLGYRLKSNIVIVGVSKAEIVPNTMGATIRSFKGSVSVRALRTDTGEEIASINQESVTVNADETAGGQDSLTNAGMLAGQALAAQIVQAWKLPETASGPIELLVTGTNDLGSFVAFRRAVNGLPGVKQLQIKELKPDEATLLVDYNGTTQSMAEILMRKSFNNFGINIFETGAEKLRIKLVPARPGISETWTQPPSVPDTNLSNPEEEPVIPENTPEPQYPRPDNQ